MSIEQNEIITRCKRCGQTHTATKCRENTWKHSGVSIQSNGLCTRCDNVLYGSPNKYPTKYIDVGPGIFKI